MFVLRLLQAPQRRYYAQLDAQEICLALWELQCTPAKGHWVQVTALNPHWIGSTLPTHVLQPKVKRISSGRWRFQQIRG